MAMTVDCQEDALTIPVAGHVEGELTFLPVCSCGSIRGGCGLEHGREGGWVIAFKDLERMYRLAAGCRSSSE